MIAADRRRWVLVPMFVVALAACSGDIGAPEGDRTDNNGPNNGANNGSNNGVNNGSNNGANNGSNNGANNGSNNGANNGGNNGFPPPSDPNMLDQRALFMCDGEPGSSPARVRRLNRNEFTRTVSKPIIPNYGGSVARNNPFDPPAAAHFSTYSEDVSIDTASLDLYFDVLTEAGIGWTERDPRSIPGAARINRVYEDSELRCMFNDADPSDECVDYYITSLLKDGVLFRPPTQAEYDQLYAFWEEQHAEEQANGGERVDTLKKVTSAAWLTSGALFRREVGEPEADEHGRHRLTDWELAKNVGYMLSDRAPGTPGTFAFQQGPPEHGSWTAPYEGYLADIKMAADSGTISDPGVVGGLIRTYAAGIDENRYDLNLDYREDRRARRGEYWVSDKIGNFFREWLDYGDFPTIFKETPYATSMFDDDDNWDTGSISSSYGNLQSGYYGDEPTMVQLMDDTIARIVQEDTEVLATILTTRRWYVAANTAYEGSSIDRSTNEVHRPFGLTVDIETTRESRWTEVPEGERAGLLTHPAWLAAHGDNFEDGPSAIHRGKWVREELFCQRVPGLELVMVEAQLVPSDPAKSARDRIIESTNDNQECVGCHSLMNPIGLAFETYNHAGFYRAEDHGRPPDGSTTIDNAPDPALNGEITDAASWMSDLADSRHVKQCFIRQTFRYFMGRNETLGDACTLVEMETAYDESGGSFITMLEALAESDAFLYRHYDEVEP